MNRESHKWLDNLPVYIRGGDDSLDDGEVAGWIMQRFGTLYPDEFVSVVNKLGYSLSSKTMDLATVQAMWQSANINIIQQRILLRFLKGSFGSKCRIACTDDKRIKERVLDNVGKYTPVSPVCGFIEVEDEEISYWHKDIQLALNFSIVCRIFNDKGGRNLKLQQDTKKVILVMGGDHGQERF